MKLIIRALSAQAEKERVKRENKRRFARRVDCIRAFITPKTREQLERMKQEHDQLFDRREDCRQAFMKRLKDKAEAVGDIPLVRYYHALNLLKVECRKRIKEQRKWAAFRAAQRPPEITTSSINRPSLSTCSSSNQTAAQSDTGSEEGYQFCEEDEMGKRKNKHRHQNKTRQAVIIPERVKVVDRNVQTTPVKALHGAVNDFLSWCDDQQQEEESEPDYGEYQDYANMIGEVEQQQAEEAAAEALATPEPPPVQTHEEAIAFFYQCQANYQKNTQEEEEYERQRRKEAQAAAEAAEVQELTMPENPQPVPRPEPVKRKVPESYRRARLLTLKFSHPDIYEIAIADPDMTPEEAWALAGRDLSKPAEYKPRQADPKALAEAEAYGSGRGYTPDYATSLNITRRRMIDSTIQQIRTGKPEQDEMKAPEDLPEEPAPLPEKPEAHEMRVQPPATEESPKQEDKDRGCQHLERIQANLKQKVEYSRTVQNAGQHSASNTEQQKEAARQRYQQWQQHRQQQRGPWNFKQEPQQRNNSFFKDEINF